MGLSQEKLAAMALELFQLQRQNSVVDKKINALKAELKQELPLGTHTLGDVVVELKDQTRTNLDRKKLEDALGEENLKPYMSKSVNRQIEVRAIELEAIALKVS
jgi:hypothetical protein